MDSLGGSRRPVPLLEKLFLRWRPSSKRSETRSLRPWPRTSRRWRSWPARPTPRRCARVTRRVFAPRHLRHPLSCRRRRERRLPRHRRERQPRRRRARARNGEVRNVFLGPDGQVRDVWCPSRARPPPKRRTTSATGAAPRTRGREDAVLAVSTSGPVDAAAECWCSSGTGSSSVSPKRRPSRALERPGRRSTGGRRTATPAWRTATRAPPRAALADMYANASDESARRCRRRAGADKRRGRAGA